MGLLHEQVTARILATFFDVYNELGHSFLEKVFHEALTIALTDSGLQVARARRFEVWFRGRVIGQFIPDMIVNERVLVEIKSERALNRSDEAQLLNYLRVTPIEVGLLLNFGPKPEYTRRILTNDRKLPPAAWVDRCEAPPSHLAVEDKDATDQ